MQPALLPREEEMTSAQARLRREIRNWSAVLHGVASGSQPSDRPDTAGPGPRQTGAN